MKNPLAALAKVLPNREVVRAYQLRLSREDISTDIILGDLAVFCGLQETTAKPDGQGRIDPYAMAVAEGRRQVWLRITAMLEMDQSTLWRLAQQARQLEVKSNG
jgi:hypothetical protein